MRNLQLLQTKMTEILTLEQISDIDTFTLQQKIEELQHHPFAKFYQQLIAIAKLELNERYKVQQFGRMLMNDQIPILPELQWKKQKQIVNKKQPSKSLRKIQYAQCLKRSLITNQKQLVIGKPALGNYRYVEPEPIKYSKQTKPKKVQQKKFESLNTKKNDIKKIQKLPKLNTIQINHISLRTSSKNESTKKQKNEKKSEERTQKSVSTLVKSQTVPIMSNLKNKQITHIQVPQIQQKPKQIKPYIKYIENDVYDGEKLVLDQPQKLAQMHIQTQNSTQQKQSQFIQNLHQEDQVILQDIKQQANNIQLKQQQKQAQNYHQKTESSDFHNKIEEKIKTSIPSIKNQINKNLGQTTFQSTSEYIKQSEQINQNNRKSQFKQEKIIISSSTISPFEENKTKQLPLLNLDKVDKKVKSYSYTASIGSKSSRVLGHDKNPVQMIQKQQQFEVITVPVAKIQNYQSQLNTKTKIQNKTAINFHKKNKISAVEVQKQRPIQNIQKIIPLTFPYNQIIPSFSKLFPHSNNLINDLRSIQKQLSDHLTKQINKLSLTDQYLRIRQNQLLFKVVSQTQKANKYRHIFDINLDNFFKRSHIMLSRLKNPHKQQNQQNQNNNILLYRVVRQKQDVYDIINNTFHRTQNWYQLPHGMDLKMSWNLLWTWSKPQIDIKQLFYFQKVNHFFGNKQIARKDLLKKNIERIKKLGAKAKISFDIIPQTYFLPGQNIQFVRKFRQYSLKAGLNYWIMKPIGLSRGRGIQLITKLQQIVFSQPVVIQKYLDNPFLLDGYKFDMRIYVLVTSINPLQAYVYREGFARISTQKYSLEDQDIHNKFVHLTNFSVQKQNLENQKQNKPKQIFALSALQKQLGGCKITLKTLKQKLLKNNISWQQIQSQIDSIVLKSLISTMNVIQQNPNCFQLFGYDIIIDDKLKCWLIQVNSSPSLQKDFMIDQIVKQQLVDDIMEIVDPIAYDRERLLQVVTRRRKQLEGLKSHINTQNNSTSQLNNDLHYILHGKPLRRYGQPVQNKNFRRIAPGQIYQSIIKTVQQYKLTSITKQEQH